METTTSYNDPFATPAPPPVRPQFLTVLCVLSFIWSGIAIVVLLIAMAASGLIFGALEKIVNGDMQVNMSESQVEAISKLLELGTGAFMGIIAVALVAVLISLFGVIRMWKLRKSGFYIYAVINGVMVLFNLVGGSFLGPMFAIAFIVMYGLNLKYMR